MVYQDYELVSTKRVNNSRNTFGSSIIGGRLFNAAGGWSAVYFGALSTYTYISLQRVAGVQFGNAAKFALGAPAFAGGLVLGMFLVGQPREFSHICRNFFTYRKEFKNHRNELYFT